MRNGMIISATQVEDTKDSGATGQVPSRLQPQGLSHSLPVAWTHHTLHGCLPWVVH